MEEKQLDFNAPLLSVRRFSSKAASSEEEKTKKTENTRERKPYLPFYKSDLKSGPMRNAGAIPFTWEQIPGRPKDEGGSGFRSLQRPPVAPKLPPGRNLQLKQVKQQPFVESEGKKTVARPPNDNVYDKRQNSYSLKANVTTLESSKEGMKEKDNSDSNSEDGDDAYADALDTLSRSESFFYNCSISGVSGLDGPDAKSSGVFSSDPQTRDFMMGRFLPAAKAMASETPQYAPRRQPIIQEPPSQVKKVVNGERRPTVYQYRPNTAQHVQDAVEEESEDEDDNFSEVGDLSTKACGLLPRFCLKNSLCLLNPVPGMKVRSRAPLPSIRKVTQVKTAYSGSRSATNEEGNWDAVYRHKRITVLQPLEEESKLTSDSNRLTWSSDSQTPDGSSPNVGSGGGGISPYRNDTPLSPFNEGRGFLGIPEQIKNFKDDCVDPYKNNHINYQGSLIHLNGKQGSDFVSPMVEKTLHVDSVRAVPTENSKLSLSDIMGLKGNEQEGQEIVMKSEGTEGTSVSVSHLGDTKSLIVSKETGVLQPKFSEAVRIDSRSSSDRSNPERHNIKGFRKDDGRDHESRALVCSEVSTSQSLVLYKPQVSLADDQRNSSFNSPLPPPLPKSPSESWLWRTLPSISSRNGAQFHPRKQSIKTPSIDPKWETIVKTSNVHHGHLRFSEELKTPLSQQSET